MGIKYIVKSIEKLVIIIKKITNNNDKINYSENKIINNINKNFIDHNLLNSIRKENLNKTLINNNNPYNINKLNKNLFKVKIFL